MRRLIDANELKKDIMSYKTMPEIRKAICEVIDDAPTVEPTFGMFRAMFCETCQAYATNRAIAKLADDYTRPQDTRPHGKWIIDDGLMSCSLCQGIVLKRHFDYCPNCGARMEESR